MADDDDGRAGQCGDDIKVGTYHLRDLGEQDDALDRGHFARFDCRRTSIAAYARQSRFEIEAAGF